MITMYTQIHAITHNFYIPKVRRLKHCIGHMIDDVNLLFTGKFVQLTISAISLMRNWLGSNQ